MKTIILAGGLGTRLAEETDSKPKPMVEINGKPILWHIMQIYALQGFHDFVIATGYKAELIESWAKKIQENWNVTTLYTGESTQTGGRIKKCMEKFLDDRYFVTYGDGLGNIDLIKLLETHTGQKRLATVTAVRPPARFGVLDIEDSRVAHFGEKKQADAGWINGGFFVLERKVLDYLSSDSDAFENTTLPALALCNELTANLHTEFWKPMDTLREKRELEELAKLQNPPWYKDLREVI
jgi:glucose-1-phosphate cytidylyltransferase